MNEDEYNAVGVGVLFCFFSFFGVWRLDALEQHKWCWYNDDDDVVKDVEDDEDDDDKEL